MAHLSEQTWIERPPGETQFCLEAYFASLQGVNGVARLRLRVPIMHSAGASGLSVSREVRIEAQPVGGGEGGYPRIRIAWEPEGRTVLPKFGGTLVVRGDRNTSCIELSGDYRPPMGVAGELFDEVIGHRIAESTAREFLKDLKRAVESRQAGS